MIAFTTGGPCIQRASNFLKTRKTMVEDDDRSALPMAIPGDRLFAQLMELWVKPEILRRQEGGAAPRPMTVNAAQVIFFPDEQAPLVRLNREIRLEAKAAVESATDFEIGQIAELKEFALTTTRLPESEYADCGHITAVRTGGEWLVAFDGRYNRGLASQHIERAAEFSACAVGALQSELVAAAIDNLHSAAELAARATLLLLPDQRFREKATHRAIHSRFNRWAKLGNVDGKYRDALNRLVELRPQARYLKGALAVSIEDVHLLSDVVAEMITDAQKQVD